MCMTVYCKLYAVVHKVSGGEKLLTLLADSYYNKGEGQR